MTKDEEKAARLAAALRANLRKRKEQARAGEKTIDATSSAAKGTDADAETEDQP